MSEIIYYIPDKREGILIYNEAELPDGYTIENIADLFERKEPVPYLKNSHPPRFILSHPLLRDKKPRGLIYYFYFYLLRDYRMYCALSNFTTKIINLTRRNPFVKRNRYS